MIYLSNNAGTQHASLRAATIWHEPTLRKHAYSNILKISQAKTESFQIKNSDIFHISAKNIDCE